MKYLFPAILAFFSITTPVLLKGQEIKNVVAVNTPANAANDSVKLVLDGNYAYYQKVVKVDSVPSGIIYVRAMQFMAAKNFQQTYGYEEEGKLIFTTSQDLNISAVSPGDENEPVNPYNVQFSISVDLKNFRYRYTINNVVFFLPTDAGNKRETLDEIYEKTVSAGETRRMQRLYRSVIDSFERYITRLVTELREGIQEKRGIYSAKF